MEIGMTKENSAKGFVKKYKENFIVVGILLIFFIIMFVINGCFPFGDGTVLVSDSYLQICPFFEYLFKVFEGDASIFYTNTIGGGFEILSTILYMLLNPFYLIALLGGKSHCYQMFNFSLIAMMIFNAFVFLWFSRKYFKKIKPTIRILLCLLFTFSGYAVLNYAFMTWLIYPALILLVIDGLYTLTQRGKIAKFTIFTIWYVLNCYSIGIFSSILLLTLFIFYVLFMVPKNNRRFVLTKLLVSYLISISVCVIVLFPAIVSVLKTNRTGFAIAYILSGNNSFNALNFTGIFVDGAVLIFALIFVIDTLRKNPKSNISKFLISAMVVLFVPIFFNISQLIINGGFFSGFPNRLYVILMAGLFICAQQKFNRDSLVDNKDEQYSSKIMFKILYIFMAVILSIFLVCMLVLQFDEIGSNTKNPVTENLGLVQFFLTITLALVLIFAFVLIFYRRKVLSKKIFKFNILFIMICSCLVNAIAFTGSASQQVNENIELKSALESLSNKDVRIKNFYNETVVTNLTNLDAQNMTIFSSLLPESVIENYSSLGYYSSLTLVDASANFGSLIADSLMGFKYYVSSEELNRPYLSIIYEDKNYFVYENLLATTGAVLFDENYSFDNSKNEFENFEMLKDSFGIDGNLFSEIDLTAELIVEREDENIVKISYTASEDGILYSNLYPTILSEEEKQEYNLNQGENVLGATDIYSVFSDIGFVRAGEEFELFVVCDKTVNSNDFEFKFLNYGVASELCRRLQENDVGISYGKMGYTVSGTAEEGKKLVVFDNDINGMQYVLNGSQISLVQTIANFASFVVEEGDFVLDATYTVSYAKTWAIVAVCLILFAAIVILLYKLCLFNRPSKVIYVLFIIALCGILSIFYFFPIILTFFVIIL